LPGGREVLRRRSSELIAVLFGGATLWLLLGRVDRGFDFDESVAIATVISRGSATVPLVETHVYNNHPLFAVVQSIWWSVGGISETRQRLLPILYGVAAVVLLVWWVARRWSAWAGVAAGCILMLNPMFIAQSRLVRGYSLALLGMVVSVLALLEYLRARGRSESSDRRMIGLLVAHAVGAIVAVGTHSFFAVPLAAVGVGVLVGRLADPRVVRAWIVSAIALALVYLPTIHELVSRTASRGAPDRPWFGRLLTWEVLGRDRLTAVVVGVAALIGVAAAAWSLAIDRTGDRPRLVVGSFRPAAPAALAVAVASAWSVWQLVSPPDLYPRFFLGMVPLIALLVGRATRLLPVLAAIVVVAQLFTLGNVLDARQRVVPIREVAAVVDGTRALSLTPCVIGGDSVAAYTSQPDEFAVHASRFGEQFERCDVLVQVGSWGLVVRAAAAEAYPYAIDFGGGIRGWSVVPPDELVAS
jgi:uncharacterized membrane protein